MRTINKTPIHGLAKKMDTTVNQLREDFLGFAMICGHDSVDEMVSLDLKRGLSITQIAKYLREI